MLRTGKTLYCSVNINSKFTMFDVMDRCESVSVNDCSAVVLLSDYIIVVDVRGTRRCFHDWLYINH